MHYALSIFSKKMNGKRKLAQISNEDQKSDDLSSTSKKKHLIELFKTF